MLATISRFPNLILLPLHLLVTGLLLRKVYGVPSLGLGPPSVVGGGKGNDNMRNHETLKKTDGKSITWFMSV